MLDTLADLKQSKIAAGESIKFDDIDIAIISIGMVRYNLENELKTQIPVHVAGDTRKIGDAQDAIRDIYETVTNL